MNIVVAVRCYNNAEYVHRFLRGYDFADQIVVSDGGSTDGSVELLQGKNKVKLIHFEETETLGGHTWNPDAPHMNYVLDAAKSLDPDWLIFDDFDCVPTLDLRTAARDIFMESENVQINAFRLYLWGEKQYFPLMNNYFDPNYTSLWAWRPKELNIRADMNLRHGTLLGLATENIMRLQTPFSLLHKSWHPNTINDKINKYNAVGIEMSHPTTFAGNPEKLPLWAYD